MFQCSWFLNSIQCFYTFPSKTMRQPNPSQALKSFKTKLQEASRSTLKISRNPIKSHGSAVQPLAAKRTTSFSTHRNDPPTHTRIYIYTYTSRKRDAPRKTAPLNTSAKPRAIISSLKNKDRGREPIYTATIKREKER